MALGRGRQVMAQTRNIHGLRDLVPEDIVRLTEPRQRVAPLVKKLRDSHHNLARFLALGLRDWEAGVKAGYSIGRVSLLQKDPSFIALVEYYRGIVNETYREQADEYIGQVTDNMVKAERMIADRLEKADDEETPLPIKDLLAISRDGADRTGRGKKITNVNVNVDFAAALERRIKKTQEVIDLPASAVRRV